jgi:GrpB-like predicted nucleotidyltransferase (UPF0157 family)
VTDSDADRRTNPMTDEQIRQATIGELKPLEGTVMLMEYDPAWPEKFAREADRIKTSLGERAIMVEHVGSTAVPGLVAKPVIDILLVVRDSSDEPSYVPALENAGYALRIREPDWHEHRLFKTPDSGVNLHVFSEGSDEIARTLMFRDRLRADQADRDTYSETKRQLANKTWKYMQNYADAKSEVIDKILARAKSSPG